MQPTRPPEPPLKETATAAIGRRAAIGIIGASSVGSVLGADASETHAARKASMKITCFIRYQIDPYQREAFKEYAQKWGRIIPRCGGHLVGYFLPSEGTNDVGWGVIAFESLAAYETYRARLSEDPEGRDNFAMAQAKRFILREERTFVEVVDGTFGVAADLSR